MKGLEKMLNTLDTNSNGVKIIAELSCNFMGDIKLAEKMICSAAQNGADFVKFQTWRVKNLKSGTWDKDGTRKIYEKSELDNNKHKILLKICKDNNVEFLSSCFSIPDLLMVRNFSDKVKIASTECRNCRLVEKALSIFDIVFISTGTCSFEEYSRWAKYNNAFLLHCVSKYPCPASQVNLNKMLKIKSITNRYGYSGHYYGIYDAIAAISLGAKMIEKHFTIDRNLLFKDNKFSILPNQLKEIRKYADEYLKMMIDHGCDFQNDEKIIRDLYSGRWDI